MHHLDANKTHEKKNLDGNYTKMLRGVLNQSWIQYSTKQQLYGRLSPISQTIQEIQDTGEESLTNL